MKALLDVIDLMPDAVFIADQTQRIVACNADVEPLFGYAAGELIGRHINVLIPREYHEIHAAHVTRFSESGGSRLMDGRPVLSGLTKAGALVPISIGISMIEEPGERYFLAAIRDARSVEDTLELAVTESETDPLTGLGNRRCLAKLLAWDTDTEQHALALLYLDLDRFKPLNDRFGHDAGDEVLRIVAKRLNGSVRERDTCIRIGGDEFVVLLRGVSNEHALARIAHKIHARVTQPFHFDEFSGAVGVSIGGVIATPGQGDAGPLIEQADTAMYVAKRTGLPFYLHPRNTDEARTSAA